MFRVSLPTKNRNRAYAIRAMVIAFSAAFLILAVETPLPSGMYSRPRIPYKNSQLSLNWAGYVVTGTAGSVTSVTGTFQVPTVATSKGQNYAAFWVGIDGDGSNTVEQAGVLALANGKTVTYSAWYEFYPAASVTISSINVSPGDTVTVTVSSTNANYFTITLTDGSQTPFTVSQTVSGAQRVSAEWIVERPSIGGSITKLADFGTAAFSGASWTGTASSRTDIKMVDRSGHTLAAVLTTWNSGSFSVKFYQAN